MLLCIGEYSKPEYLYWIEGKNGIDTHYYFSQKLIKKYCIYIIIKLLLKV